MSESHLLYSMATPPFRGDRRRPVIIDPREALEELSVGSRPAPPNFPPSLSAISTYAGYVSAGMKAAEAIGFIQSDKDAIIAEIRKVAALIAEMKRQIFKFLEDQEERQVLARISGAGADIESYTISGNDTYRQTMRANIVTRMNKDMFAIADNIDRLYRARDYKRALRYAGMLGVDLANRHLLASEVLSQDGDEREARSVRLTPGSTFDRLEQALSKAKASARKEVPASTRIRHINKSRGGGRIRGYRVTKVSGIQEWETFVPVTGRYDVYEPGEKTRTDTPEYRRKMKRQRERLKPIRAALNEALANRQEASMSRLLKEIKVARSALDQATSSED